MAVEMPVGSILLLYNLYCRTAYAVLVQVVPDKVLVWNAVNLIL